MCLLTDEIEFRGHTISDDKIRVSEKRIEALKMLTISTSAGDAQSLFAVRKYFSLVFFHSLLKSQTKTYADRFQWIEEATKSLENISDKIIDQTMNLTISDFN